MASYSFPPPALLLKALGTSPQVKCSGGPPRSRRRARGRERGREQNVSNEKMRWEMGLKKGRRGTEGGKRGTRLMQENGGRSARRKGERGGQGGGCWIWSEEPQKRGSEGERSEQPSTRQADTEGDGVWLHQTPYSLSSGNILVLAGCFVGSFLPRAPCSLFLPSTGLGWIVQQRSAILGGMYI